MKLFIDRWYLKPKIPKELAALFSAQLIKSLGWGMTGIFLPIFLYEQFGSLEKLFIYYAISSLYFVLTISLGARLMTKIGMKKSMIVSLPFLSAHFLYFYFVDQHNFFLFLAISLSVFTFYRILYWIPYHSEFAELTTFEHRGKEIGFLRCISAIVHIVVPLLGALVIITRGFNQLFIAAAILCGVSIIPLFFLKERKQIFVFSYWQTFKEYLKKANRRIAVAFGADGAVGAVGGIVWPIFIYGILEKKYLAVGAISTLIALATIVLRLVVGTYLDRIKKRNIVKIGSILVAFGWVLRMFLRTAFQIFVVGTYHNFAGIIRSLSFDTLMYEEAADHGMFVDEYTAIREVSLHVGRVLMILVLIGLIIFLGVNMIFAFLLAAIASLFINVL